MSQLKQCIPASRKEKKSFAGEGKDILKDYVKKCLYFTLKRTAFVVLYFKHIAPGVFTTSIGYFVLSFMYTF